MINVSIKIYTTFLLIIMTGNTNGQGFCYEVKGKKIYFTVKGKSDGWVLLGFNAKSTDLAGSYLVFGSYENGAAMIEDHYVLRQGVHTSLFDLGEGASLRDCSFLPGDSEGTLSFSLPLENTSSLAPNFKTSRDLTVWLAYSNSPDFNHHSVYRKSKKLQFKLEKECFYY